MLAWLSLYLRADYQVPLPYESTITMLPALYSVSSSLLETLTLVFILSAKDLGTTRSKDCTRPRSPFPSLAPLHFLPALP